MRTWHYNGRDWPYDDETSAEIDARVQRAKGETLLTIDDLEWYEYVCSDVDPHQPEPVLTDG